MSDETPNGRRDFLKSASVAAAAVALGDAAHGESPASSPACSRPAETPRPLNYNPRMGYRRLGKTGIMISEISLGGHGGQSLEDRVPVLEKAAELGVNYLDTNIAEEADLYARALSGRRERFHIGFASWPERLTPDWEPNLSQEGMTRDIEARLKSFKTDTLDIWRPVGASWGEGQTRRETLWDVSPRVLDMVVEVFEKVHKAGKVRWLGISAHNDRLFRRVLTDYPQFSVILFPYLFLTEPQGGDSILALARRKDVGVIGIKPFAAGTTFGLAPQQISDRLDPRAHRLLKIMLAEQRISALVPGVNDAAQLAENVRASYERDEPVTEADRRALRECERNFRAHVTPEYAWLYDWRTA